MSAEHISLKGLNVNICTPSWFDKWPWLRYNEERDVAFCHICLKAKEEKKIMWSNNGEEAFMGKGFTN